MNIFVLDETPEICATYHCDSHVIKMILESVQMLSTTVRSTGVIAGYRPTHKNHPCSKWARESIQNYQWLKQLTHCLNKEYIYRYDKVCNHKSYDMMLTLPDPELPDIGLTPFAQAMPEKYRGINPVQAYREYYVNDKSHLFKYTKRNIPEFIKEISNAN